MAYKFERVVILSADLSEDDTHALVAPIASASTLAESVEEAGEEWDSIRAGTMVNYFPMAALDHAEGLQADETSCALAYSVVDLTRTPEVNLLRLEALCREQRVWLHLREKHMLDLIAKFSRKLAYGVSAAEVTLPSWQDIHH